MDYSPQTTHASNVKTSVLITDTDKKTCDLREVWEIHLETHAGERYESGDFTWPLQL